MTSSVSGRVGSQRADKLPHIQVAVAIYAQKSNLVTVPLKFIAYLQHGRMFHGGRYNVATVRIGFGSAKNSRIVAFRRTGGKQD